jgi:hypothetical protein
MCGTPVRAVVMHRRRALHLCRACLPVIAIARKPRETRTLKAKRLARSGLQIVRTSERLTIARVRGDTGTYLVSKVGQHPAACTCAAGLHRLPCSHGLALSIALMPGRRP